MSPEMSPEIIFLFRTRTLESASLFRSALCPRLNPDRHNGDFLWALVAVMVVADVAEAAALFAVASKAELRFIAIKSFVLSATRRRRHYASFGAI